MTIERIIGSPIPFLEKIFKNLEREHIDVTYLELDHLCYRVQTLEQYEIKKNELSKLAEILIEAPVNGRLISTFKLHSPIFFQNRTISLIELPAPKPGSHHGEGLEHVEFVIKDSFETFQEHYKHLSFNTKGAKKVFNPELEIEFSDCAVKFHHLSLEQVIQCEKNLIPTYFTELTSCVPHLIYEANYFTTNNFTGEKIRGYDERHCVLTREAAEALIKVSLELKKQNLGLKIFDAYRPVRAVEHFLHWAKEKDQMHLFETGFLAYKSSHSRGSTIDLTLYDLTTQKELDMGTSFDEFTDKAFTDSADITEAQKNNRQILLKIMKQCGFRNYEQEWWHFTLINEPFRNVYFDFPIRAFA